MGVNTIKTLVEVIQYIFKIIMDLRQKEGPNNILLSGFQVSVFFLQVRVQSKPATLYQV